MTSIRYTERVESTKHIYLCRWDAANRIVTARAIRTDGQVFSVVEKHLQ